MQPGLFDDSKSIDQCRQHNLAGAFIDEYPNAFAEDLSQKFFDELLTGIPWRQEQLRIAGKLIDVPRLQCWMGDRGSRYGYSGMRLEPEPWIAAVSAIRTRVETLAGTTFNSVLLNLYRDGQDSVAWHADDENELGPSPLIASVSLGTTRRFELKPKSPRRGEKYTLQLATGSVLIMHPGLQEIWMHQIPKERAVDQARINLTFRQIVN